MALKDTFQILIKKIKERFYTKDESNAKYVTDISYNDVSKTINQTKNGVVTDVVSVNVIKGDLDLTKSDVGLNNVVNTGDSATPTLNGTDKFTTGGAYVMQQDINSKVSNVAYDTTGKKLTKTINGTISDIVDIATIKTDLEFTKSDIGLGNVTNDRQIMGLASGTTQGDIVTFGLDGYSVQDSGKSFSNVVDENSTDEQVPTAKSVYDELVNVGAVFTVTYGTWDNYEN